MPDRQDIPAVPPFPKRRPARPDQTEEHAMALDSGEARPGALVDPFPLDPDALAEAIDIPLSAWPGNCHGIARAILDLVPVRGLRLMRGHYLGEVSRKSIFDSGISQHSWLEADDGRILDPTRWAFDRPTEPYIYLGPCDAYDACGFALRAAMAPPFPGAGPDASGAIDALQPGDRAHLAALLGFRPERIAGAPTSTLNAALVTALRQDPDTLEAAADIYRMADRLGLGALIQIDARHRVLEPERITARPDANRYFRLPPAERIEVQELAFRLLHHFVMIERRAGLEAELAEFDITLEQYWSALTRLEKVHDFPLRYLPSDDRYVLGLALSEILGRGFGEALRVERYARSLGYDRVALDAAMEQIGSAFRIDLRWS